MRKRKRVRERLVIENLIILIRDKEVGDIFYIQTISLEATVKHSQTRISMNFKMCESKYTSSDSGYLFII